MSITAEDAQLDRDVKVREAQILAADCTTCGAEPGELCTDMCGWPVLEPVTRPVGRSHDARLVRAMPGLAELTREEAAYAHLASFARGQDVIVSGHGFMGQGVVTVPQREMPHAGFHGAYLVVDADVTIGTWPHGTRQAHIGITVTVARLLNEGVIIATPDDARDRRATCFDAATWALQNTKG
jgi:hypothetical protein